MLHFKSVSSDRAAFRSGLGWHRFTWLAAAVVLGGAGFLIAQSATIPDTSDVDHVGLLEALDDNSFIRGKRIYEGLCINCHGSDGLTATLPNAAAFGKGELKFGNDPFSMFMTLTDGNGEMLPQSWMTPSERYDVIHYIREAFMKGTPDYTAIDEAYLATLPEYVPATDEGDAHVGARDHGPALGAPLGKDHPSALIVRLAESTTLAYNLHTMQSLGVWRGAFLDVSETHHMRLRGEGEPQPGGLPWRGLSFWGWGHEGTLDYEFDYTPPHGPKPRRWLHYRGHYLNGDRTILSYAIDGRDILEMPLKEPNFEGGLTHVLHIGPGEEPLLLAVGRWEPDDEGAIIKGVAALEYVTAPTHWQGEASDYLAVAGWPTEDDEIGRYVAALARGDVAGMSWQVDEAHRLVLHIPASEEPRRIEITRQLGTGLAALENLAGLHAIKDLRGSTVADLTTLLSGGPQRWGQTFQTQGVRGSDDVAYTLDTLTLPQSTPWNVWFRTSGLDFFSDGRMVVATHGGDIWIVSNIDDSLQSLQWKRFAAGLYEPFGVRVINDVVHLTCRDRIVRLHDLNGNGEADYYESIFDNPEVSSYFHAYAFGLEHDAQGHLYFVKSGIYSNWYAPHPGAVLRITPDGSEYTVLGSGLRAPNGMGVMPDGRLTVSDNQGHWIPASRINIVREDAFYGFPRIHDNAIRYGWDWFALGDGEIQKLVTPSTFDQPIIWMPQSWDNSSGGQVTADATRYGPLSGRFMHTSFGKGWMYYLTIQDVGDVTQAAVVRLPHQFMTGIMRARINPADGQVYATGLTGWGGPPHVEDGGVQRLRYTGKPYTVLTQMHAHEGGLRLAFNRPLDPQAATNTANYKAEHWNYRWRPEYGSPEYHPSDPEKEGREKIRVASVTLSSDGRTVTLHMPDIQPAHQLQLDVTLRMADGDTFDESILMTIHALAP